MTAKKNTGYKRIIQEPTVTKETDSMGGSTYSHPAYGQISASRISGTRVLYGSDFTHSGSVRITIFESQLRRSLSNDWPHARGQLIEVELSEAQWATFVSSLNMGSGTQCTLRQVRGQDQIPELPDPVSRRDQFTDEAKEACTEALAAIRELQAAIADTNLSNKAKEALIKKAGSVESRLTSSLPFVLDQFGEHMEKTTEKAKVEINAYATNAVMRAGIASLGGTDNLPLSLAFETPKDKPE